MKERKAFGLFGDSLVRFFFALLGVFLVIKAHEDEWHIVIKFTDLEVLRFFVLSYSACPRCPT